MNSLSTRAIGASLLSLLTVAVQADEYRIDPVAKPIQQTVFLRVDPKLEQYNGKVSIELDVIKATRHLQFSGLDYTPNTLLLTGKANCALKATMGEHGVVTANCASELPVGRYQLDIEFSAPYNRKSVGLYKTIDQNEAYLFTQFEMNDARRAFPVFDEPEYKIPFQLTIAAPKGHKVYANTPETKTTESGEWVTHEFAKTLPIPSYLVAMAVGPFEEVAVEGMRIPGRVITTKGKSAQAKYAAKEMPKILAALEQYFGRPYPYEKLDSVAVPEYPFGAMENAGLITYREDVLLIDEARASVGQKTNTVGIIAHEIAHQWYGNLVTMKWWNDLWLNEAFASWMASKIVVSQYPELESHLSLPQNQVMTADALLTTKPIRKPIKTEADIMDGLGLAYSKGSAVLSLVEQWIGEEAFRTGIRQYLNDFAFKNAEADDLWNALGKASKKDVAAVLRSYIEQSSFPLLSVDIKGKMLTLQQQRFVNAGVTAPAQMWTVPVNIKYGKGNKTATTSVLMKDAVGSVTLEFEPDWVYPDTDAKGYYRFVLSDKLRDASLVHFTEKNLNPRERLAFIAGSSDLVNAGKMTGANFLRVLGGMLNDSHPRVVSSALGNIAAQREVYVNATNEAAWGRYVQKQSQAALQRFGVVSQANDPVGVDGIRRNLLNLLAFEIKDAKQIADSKKMAAEFLQDASKADPRLIDSHMAIAAFYGDEALFKQMKSVFESTKTPQVRTTLLGALSYFGDAALQHAVLDYLLTDAITASDMRYAFYGHMFKDERYARMRAWVYKNYDALIKKTPPFVVPSVPTFVGSGCDMSVYSEAEKFFADKIQANPGYVRTLAKLKESVSSCAALRERESAGVNQYLQQF